MSTIPSNAFVLVDGSSYLFRAYHALPPLTNSKGLPTGAIYGVINMLRKLINEYQPEYVAVVFDCKEKTFRHDMYPEYKANRTEMPAELAEQIKPLHDIVKAMGLPLIAIPGVEADDVIGTLAREASADGLATIISTGDKDMAQLVDEHVLCVNTMTDKIMDRAGVIEKFAVTPEQIIDYLSLIGDTVDNIPGVYKVGPKTAVKWMQEYNSLDNIVANADKIGGKVGENLRAVLSDLPLYKQLITIKTDVPLDVSYKDLLQNPADNIALQQLYTELEFKTWLKQLDLQQPIHNPEYELVTSIQQLNSWIDGIHKHGMVAFDTETTSLNYINAELVGISLAVEPHKAAYVPVAHAYLDAPQQLSRAEVLKALQPILDSPAILKICHNLKYDMEVMANYNQDIVGENFDTMLASYVINSVGSRHNMDALAEKYLNTKTISYEEVAGKGVKQVTFDQVLLDKACEYAAQDADITLQFYKEFTRVLQDDPKLKQVFATIEMPLVPVLVAMERRGVLIDVAALELQSADLSKHIATLEEQAHSIAGEEFNLGSPKQLQDVLFNKLKLPITEKTPTGQPSTGEAVLQELALEYELPRIILEYRSLSKLKSTYTDKLPLEINNKTGRVHTNYHQAVTATGRLSSSDPNLQNIPARTNEGKKIRAAFIAPEGYKLVSADYSQIELRIMAHLSADPALIDTFKLGLDVHSATASEVFGVPQDQITQDQRRHAKAINFGLIYGMSAFGLAKQLGISRESSQLYIDKYFERFPGVKKYMDETRILAAKQGYVETLFGRRLYLPDIKSSKVPLRRAAERAAINAPLQGAQADIIKLAMIRIHHWIQDYASDMHMIMQVHDELVFEIPTDKVGVYSEQILKIMTNAADLLVNLEVGLGIGDNWDEAH